MSNLTYKLAISSVYTENSFASMTKDWHFHTKISNLNIILVSYNISRQCIHEVFRPWSKWLTFFTQKLDIGRKKNVILPGMDRNWHFSHKTLNIGRKKIDIYRIFYRKMQNVNCKLSPFHDFSLRFHFFCVFATW